MLACILGTPVAMPLFHDFGTLPFHQHSQSVHRLSTCQIDLQGEGSSLQRKQNFSISVASNGEIFDQKAIMRSRKRSHENTSFGMTGFPCAQHALFPNKL